MRRMRRRYRERLVDFTQTVARSAASIGASHELDGDPVHGVADGRVRGCRGKVLPHTHKISEFFTVKQ